MKFIVNYFYEEGCDSLEYIERNTMNEALDYARAKARAQFQKLVTTQTHAPFVLTEDFELIVDQRLVRDQMEAQISYGVVEYDPDNFDDYMVMNCSTKDLEDLYM